MRFALPGSMLVHAGILGLALYGFALPEAEDAPAASAVTVDIIAVTAVDRNATEVIESDATISQTSAGSVPASEPLTPLEPETVTTETALLEPIEAKVPDGVAATSATESTRVEPIMAEPAEAVQPTEPVEAISEPADMAESDIQAKAATPVQPIAIEPAQPEAVQPIQPAPVPVAATQPVAREAIAPLSSEDLKVAPVPQMLSFERTSKPTYPDRPQQPPKPQPAEPQTRQASTAGNAGTNQADSAASATGGPQGAAGAGGQAAVDRYASTVRRKVERARPRNSGGLSGDLVVQFTLASNGQLSGLGIARSSGDAAVDAAGLAMVERAAPFAPIPPETGRTSMGFSVPLSFEN